MLTQDELATLPADPSEDPNGDYHEVLSQLFGSSQPGEQNDADPEQERVVAVSDSLAEWQRSWTRHLLVASFSTVGVAVMWQSGPRNWLDRLLAMQTVADPATVALPARLVCTLAIIIGVQCLVDHHRIAGLFVDVLGPPALEESDTGDDVASGKSRKVKYRMKV